MTKKLHFGVYARIEKGGKILLIKKIRGPYTGSLDLPGGRLEHGELPIDGVKREVMEETGVKVLAAELVDVFSHSVQYEYEGEEIDMHHVGAIYHVTEFDDSGLVCEMHEEDSGGCCWVTVGVEGEYSPFAEKVMK